MARTPERSEKGAAVVRGGFPFRSPTKMRAVRTEYNGVTYDSKREAAYAMKLDVEVAAGLIAKWERGETIFLTINGEFLYGPVSKKTGRRRRMYHRPDFVVHHLDGTKETRQVKGRRDTKDPAYRLYWLQKEVLRCMGVVITEVA